MQRLTTNKEVSEMNMVELAHNSCFAKERNATYRDFECEIDARDFVRKIGKTFGIFEDGCEEMTDDEAFDEVMADFLQYGYDEKEGLLALLYRNLWAQANLYERLKRYEDLEEQGLLLKLPCKVGDTVWINTNPANVTAELDDFGKPAETYECYVRAFSVWNEYIKIHLTCKNPKRDVGCHITEKDIGKTVFLTQAEAEAELKRMEMVK